MDSDDKFWAIVISVVAICAAITVVSALYIESTEKREAMKAGYIQHQQGFTTIWIKPDTQVEK